MKKSLFVAGLTLTLVLGVASLGFTQRRVAPREAVVKWEYCTLTANVYGRKGTAWGDGILLSEDGSTTHITESIVNYKADASGLLDQRRTHISALNQLGSQGWEVVSCLDNKGDRTWTLKRRK